MTCKKAQEFLERNDVAVAEVVDATKTRKGRSEALALAKTANRIVIAKGKKHVVFDFKYDLLDDELLLAHLLGPTGNLRAPAVKVGKTLYVGFNEQAWEKVVSDR
jgi:arsenate reductase-like glutaredoxin family protein